MNKIKKIFLFLLLIEILFSYMPAYAAQSEDYSNAGVSKQIETYLCAPPADNSPTTAVNTALYSCINKLYKFAIILAGVLGVFFIVIAGYVYMSAEGNSESVEKAKGILTSTIASIVILSAGYILLKAINPDLIQFQTIQPTNVVLQIPPVTGGIGGVSGGVSGGTVSAGGVSCAGVASANYYILAGTNYNIGPYATACNHENVVQGIYNNLNGVDLSTAQKISSYMQTNSMPGKTTPVNGQMVINACSSNLTCEKAVIALMQADSHFGTDGVRAIQNCNPGNVGNTDNGTNTNFCTNGGWSSGVNAVSNWLNNHTVTK